MIDAKELRLGNLIESYMCFDNGLGEISFPKIRDAGNWRHPEYTIYSTKGMSIGELKNEFYNWNACEDDFYSWYSPKVTYLHQLQNLYFALTQKELEVNL